MPRTPSVFSRFRLVGAAVIIGVGLVGALFYTTVSNHFFGLIISRTLGPYSDSLAEHGFASSDPDIWRRMALGHDVAILVESVDGRAAGFDREGEPLSPSEIRAGNILAVRTAADGTRVTFWWKLLSFENSHLPLLGGLLVMIGAVVGSAFWFLHLQLKPLAGLHRGVDAVGKGDFDARVPVVRDDEIGQVAAAFNVMAGRVGEMIDDRERLLGDVSHELRSPLARMKVALEFMPQGDKRQALARDLKEMEDLIAALLEREALRSRTGRLEFEMVDLKTIAIEVIMAFADRGPGVEFVANGRVAIPADSALIKLLIQNLLDNAVKFSEADSGPVMILLETEGDRAVLRIKDDGIGIPANGQVDLFAPFVKLDRARGHHSGYGIGLNLCQRIVQLHDGTIELLPCQPRGTEVVVMFKRSPTSI